ncbi:hypothetical protein ACH5RR_026833 [Cinchona calisaya]|uniref:EF-hand domain-containing protein n=1 Tax=Cinchona calisaya TaxID=153742 RepID=A0ABD2Z3Q9_9GENT
MGRITLDIETPLNTTDLRSEKVKRILQQFDLNRDGCLNRDESTALVVAVNPRVKFTDDQIHAINDEVFRTYAQFIDGQKGITLDGLLRTYDDGAGDVDRDFSVLGLELNPGETVPGPSIVDKTVREAATDNKAMEWAILLHHTVAFQNTYKLLDDLEILIQKLEKSKQVKEAKVKRGSNSSAKGVAWEDLGANYAVFLKDLVALSSRADKECSKEEAFDRHMAIGRVLYNKHLHKLAYISFRRAFELQPNNPLTRFRAGNCLYELGMYREAKEEFFEALIIAEADEKNWAYLVPQIHINLGILLEGEGMVFNACDHYREACIFCPTHFRALKRLGSGLIALGEYKAGVLALEEAVFLKKDYADAHCDLGSGFLALGDETNAINEFQMVLDLKADHLDALFNFGVFYMDRGRYERALDMYDRVLDESPNHWKALLSKAVLLLGTGKTEKARKALREALKTANRVELHDRMVYLKQLQKKWLKGKGGGVGEEAYIIVEPSKFKTVEESTNSRWELANALDIRAFQKITGLDRCDVELLKKQMNEYPLPDSLFAERPIRKVSLEGILRELLGFLKPENFVGAVKAINKKILCVLDESNSGSVDFGLFFAIIAPLCKGSLDRRERVAYHALLLQPGSVGSSKIRKTDTQKYIKLLRAIYMPPLGVSEMLEVSEETDMSMVSFTEFLEMFVDPDRGFGILSTLWKLEIGNRNGSYVCASCRFAIIGPRYKEVRLHFSLCSLCYSERRVHPTYSNQEEYIFRKCKPIEA